MTDTKQPTIADAIRECDEAGILLDCGADLHLTCASVDICERHNRLRVAIRRLAKVAQWKATDHCAGKESAT